MNKVKAIYFLASIGSLPVYEMEDGSIRLPFVHPNTRQHIWMSLKEGLATCNHKDLVLNMKNKIQFEKDFKKVQEELDTIKTEPPLKVVIN